MFSYSQDLIRVEQLSVSTMMSKVQFLEIQAHQNGLNQLSVATLKFLYWAFQGACNKMCNNPRHMIGTSDSGPDLETAMNSNLNEL